MLAEQAVAGDARCPLHVAALHAAAEDDARTLLERVRARAEAVEEFLVPVTPVIGVSAGPGLVGIACWREAT